MINFWERVQYAIGLAAEDAKYLEHPDQQELVIWCKFADRQTKEKYSYNIQIHANWLRKVGTILSDERNY